MTATRKRDFWRVLFACPPKPCPLSKTQKVELRSYCSVCNEEPYKRAEQQERMEEVIFEEGSAQRTFRCSACIAEYRFYSESERGANEGLCCARGVDEWREKERRKVPGYRKLFSRSQAPSHADFHHTVPQHPREERFPELKRMTSTQAARDAAILAAECYGWGQRGGSHDLEPQLVAAFINSSGTALNALPEAPTVTEPGYLEPGINWKQWNEAVRTNHGGYPPAAPAPESPLPIRPLQIRKTDLKKWESVAGRAELADNAAIAPQPLAIKKTQPGKGSAIPGRKVTSRSPPRSWSPSDDMKFASSWAPIPSRHSSRPSVSPAVSPLSRSPARSETKSDERAATVSPLSLISQSPATSEWRWSDDRLRIPSLHPQNQPPEDASVALRLDDALAEAWKYLEGNE
ncbi:hypothetical protein B7494_g7255 [Chlorociboria aeruginascens]|nr:hypothetical protein B7494_g7255 [Chlorociboria aeruginascens]